MSIIFDTKNKEKQVKYTCELYITNWSYSNKLGIVFAMYQRMRSKGTSWDGLRQHSVGKELRKNTSGTCLMMEPQRVAQGN